MTSSALSSPFASFVLSSPFASFVLLSSLYLPSSPLLTRLPSSPLFEQDVCFSTVLVFCGQTGNGQTVQPGSNGQAATKLGSQVQHLAAMVERAQTSMLTLTRERDIERETAAYWRAQYELERASRAGLGKSIATASLMHADSTQ